MSKWSASDFLAYLLKTTEEDEVRHAYVKYFDLPFNTKNKNDNRTDGIIFEFKLDKPLQKGDNLARVVAQAFYYVHRCLYGQVLATVPKYVVVADKNEAAVLRTEEWKDVYSPINAADWRRAPSSPDQKLINAVADNSNYKHIHVYDLTHSSELEQFSKALKNALEDKDIIIDPAHVNLDNFEAVYDHWKHIIGQYIPEDKQNTRKRHPVFFIRDLQKGSRYDAEEGVLVFPKIDGVEYKVPPEKYRWFWKHYHRPPKNEDMDAILARTDRLEKMDKRRFQGDFFTPLAFAKLGLEYIAKVLGENWYKEYKIWDMACGTGNLEYHIPTYENVFMSTIDTGEVAYMESNNMFPGATIFQYDYLNDDVELLMMGEDLLNDKAGWKLPRKLREALADPSNKWVVLMNPPYADHTGGIGTGNKTMKKGVSKSAIKNCMADLGSASREIFVQFLYRVHKEVPNSFIGVFAKTKYVNAQAYEEFRKIFQPEYKGGFIFPASTFQGTKGEWPVSFLVWDWSKKIPLETQDITMDVYDYNQED